MVLANGEKVPVLKKRALEPVVAEPIEPKETPARAEQGLDAVRVVERTVIPPQTEALIPVKCHLSGLRIIEGRSELWEKKHLVRANSVADIKHYAAFLIKIGNFTNNAVALQKNERVGRAIKAHVPSGGKTAIHVVIPGMNEVPDALSIRFEGMINN